MNTPQLLYLKILVLSLTLTVALSSCDKNYIVDGGLSKAQSSFDTYDYLANNKYHEFDTLILMIDHFGLKDSVNKAGTFFAPSDYSISRFMVNSNISSLDSLYTQISSKFLTQYMFPDTSITLTNVKTYTVLYPNWADTLSGVKKTAFTYGAANSTFTYNILQYVQINGALDGSPNAPANDPPDAILNCQTTGIKTSSGTNLNVLANTSNLLGR